MKYAIIALLLLASCVAQNPMDDMPCHQMPDGTWMGQCDNVFIPGQHSDHDHAHAKSTTIIDVEDGERVALTAEIVKKQIGEQTYTMYAYNGQIPGPAFRVKQDSRITIDFANNIDQETTIHWHGLRHDIKNDGIPGTSQEPVQPGETYTYELYFPDDGIYWYHPHVREDIQQDAGLAGNILVKPTMPYNTVNREELLMVDDILIEGSSIVPYGKEHANFAVMGRFGNVQLVNGETEYTLKANKGEVIRFYITNVANVRPYNISIPEAEVKLVGGDLGQYEQEEFVDSVIVAPAQRVFIDVFFENPGTYEIFNINPHKQYILGVVEVSEEEVGEDYSDEFFFETENPEVAEDIQAFAQYFNKDPDYKLTLDVFFKDAIALMEYMPCHQMPDGTWMGRCDEGEEEHTEILDIEWEDEMNMRAQGEDVTWIIKDEKGNKNMELELKAKIGDVTKIRLFNDPNSLHPMQHPIHLHGQRFIVTHRDGVEETNKVWTDTVLVPVGSTIDILIDVTNPGDWMIHCHIAEHLETGMMATFSVEE